MDFATFVIPFMRRVVAVPIVVEVNCVILKCCYSIYLTCCLLCCSLVLSRWHCGSRRFEDRGAISSLEFWSFEVIYYFRIYSCCPFFQFWSCIAWLLATCQLAIKWKCCLRARHAAAAFLYDGNTAFYLVSSGSIHSQHHSSNNASKVACSQSQDQKRWVTNFS